MNRMQRRETHDARRVAPMTSAPAHPRNAKECLEEEPVSGANPSDDRVMAERLVQASLLVFIEHGRFVRAAGAGGRVLQAETGGLTLRYVTPFARLARAPAKYGVEVWAVRRGKVFAVWWPPFRILVFVRGPWMNELVEHLQQGRGPEGPASR